MNTDKGRFSQKNNLSLAEPAKFAKKVKKDRLNPETNEYRVFVRICPHLSEEKKGFLRVLSVLREQSEWARDKV